MKLPVWPKDNRDIIDADGKFVCFANTATDRASIVKAINCHEKLIKALKKYGDHEPCCTKGDSCICGFEQALEGE